MTITLDLAPDQTSALLQINERFQRELEQQSFPATATLSKLKTALSDALDRQTGALEILEKALHRAGTLRLVAPDTRLRNLPWHLALEDRPLLSLVKTHRADLPAHKPTVGLPLKVLVMVSAPEGAVRLDYEAEELDLLRAFAPLMSRGLAQIHFTDDGSLENLEEKLGENRYHVLHFSGHGAYRDEKGYLLLENAETGKAERVGARAFNETLQKLAGKGHCPDLVVLSACQSAQGGQPGDLQGVADELLAGGVPAVVAMSASILDPCATEFAAALYAGLAKENPLPAAFMEALRHLREFETARVRRPEGSAPGQWLIPQLLAGADVENLYDKSQKPEELAFADARYVTGDDGLLELRGGVDRKKYRYVFIGRRTERRRALARLRDAQNPAVLLRGQGGVGKTALAEHLAVRLLAANPRVKVFTHSEKAPAFDSLLNRLRDYLSKEKRQMSVISELTRIEKLSDKLIFLLQKTGEYCDPVFIFDNVESFQKDQGGDWNLEKHEDVFTGLDILLQYTAFPLIITGRYPVREFGGLEQCDLNAVSFGDFYRKCWQLPLHRLSDRLDKEEAHALKVAGQGGDAPPNFEQVCRILHRAFGGNYRALEFFDELFTRRDDAVFGTLERLDALPEETAEDVRRRMSENLVFGELLALLSPEEKEALGLLVRFRIPVLPMAPAMQRGNRDFTTELDRLADLTLAERDTGRDGKKRYYVMPLVQDLLAESALPQAAFSEKTAGKYHDYVVQNDLSADALAEYAEAFEWYAAAGSAEEVNRIGDRLCQFYYEIQQFRTALDYGLRSEEVCQNQMVSRVLSNVGSIFQIFGYLDASLGYKLRALERDKSSGNRQGEGAMLNNISQIYKVRGDYDTALGYLQQSLKISREIGDRKGEGATLSNISQIYSVKDDYDTALGYLQQSLKIMQEIGDRQGEGVALNNISQIYSAKGDYDTALVCLQQSLKIRREIGDRKGEGPTLSNISQIYSAKGDYDTALVCLQQSLKIMQEIGDRQGEGATLNNLATIFLGKGDYNTALVYLQQSLKIIQEIGDRQGEGVTFANFGMIYQKQGDNENALKYYKLSLDLQREIGNISGVAINLTNIGGLLYDGSRLEEAIPPLLEAYTIFNNIGSPNKQVTESYLNAIIQQIGEARFQEIVSGMK